MSQITSRRQPGNATTNYEYVMHEPAFRPAWRPERNLPGNARLERPAWTPLKPATADPDPPYRREGNHIGGLRVLVRGW